MASWDFLRKNLETLSAQVSEGTKALAEQASTYGAAATEQASKLSAVAQERAKAYGEQATQAAEEARQKLQTLNVSETLNSLRGPTSAIDAGEYSEAELKEYGITPDFREFIRSLSYSTFRDFPPEEIPPSRSEPNSNADMSRYLNPWQERHALLICLSAREINELRFVLVPRRLSDEQFWNIYFLLAKKLLPAAAFDTKMQAPVPSAAAAEKQPQQQAPAPAGAGEGASAWMRNLVLGFDVPEDRVKEAANNMKGTFQQVSQQVASASASVAAAANAAMAQATAAQPAPAEPSGAAAAASTPEAGVREAGGEAAQPSGEAEAAEEPEMDADPELEAYLQAAMENDGDGEEDGEGSGKGMDDDDFDKYLNDLNDGTGSNSGDEGGGDRSSEDLDLDEYMNALQEEDKK